MRFWDTSALIPLCWEEAQTAAVRGLLDEDADIRVWWGTRVECASTIMRLVRQGNMDGAAEARVRACVASLFDGGDEVAPAEEVRLRAERLLGPYPLRTADALQLAAALAWARERPTGMGFVCLDRRLREAAHREGFEVLPASLE